MVAGVKLSGMDTWLNKLEYQQVRNSLVTIKPLAPFLLTCGGAATQSLSIMKMVFQALAGLPGLEICPSECEIDCMTPAIIKPEPRWSGKQVGSYYWFDGKQCCWLLLLVRKEEN